MRPGVILVSMALLGSSVVMGDRPAPASTPQRINNPEDLGRKLAAASTVSEASTIVAQLAEMSGSGRQERFIPAIAIRDDAARRAEDCVAHHGSAADDSSLGALCINADGIQRVDADRDVVKEEVITLVKASPAMAFSLCVNLRSSTDSETRAFAVWTLRQGLSKPETRDQALHALHPGS